jgi:hypothetical protein
MANEVILDLKEQIKIKFEAIAELQKEVAKLKQAVKDAQLDEFARIRAYKPNKRAKHVYFHPASGKWRVYIRSKYIGLYSEYFKTEQEAKDRLEEIFKKQEAPV